MRLLTIVGGDREPLVVTRRGRWKTVCSRGSNRALLGGPSTSPLAAMTGRALVGVGAAILVAGLVWILVPPFPPPATLLDIPLTALTEQFGPSRDSVEEVRAPPRSAKSVVWERSRGIAYWTLQADWSKPTIELSGPPDMVSRCLHLRWAPEWVAVLLLPCETVAKARVMASNNRWRGP